MYLDTVKQQLLERKLVSPDELLGCTPVEVRELQRRLGIVLPKAYEEFLLLMGHGAGAFLRGSDCFFAQVSALQTWAADLLKENGGAAPLPEDAWVFLMHQGYQFSFFRLSEGDNPPTYSYCEGTPHTTFIKSHASFSDFLMTEVDIHTQ
jgi:hypothetical protein